MKLFRRTELDNKLNKYHEFVQSIIKKKKEQIIDPKKSNDDLVSAFLKSNENTDEKKLTMDEIRVIIFSLVDYFY